MIGQYRTTPRRPSAGRACLTVLVMALAFAGQARAQDEPATAPAESQPDSQPADVPETTTTGVTAEEISARTAQIEADGTLSQTARNELLGLYQQALDQINIAQKWSDRAAEYRRGREEAPALLESARAALAEATTRPTTEPVLDVPADATLEQLGQSLAAAEAALKTRQEDARQLDAEAENRARRTETLPDLVGEANERRERIAASLAAPPAAGAAPQLVLAQRTLLLAQQRAIREELTCYEEELGFYEARRDLLAARREKARLLLAEAQATASAWRTLVAARRSAEVEQEKQRAEAELQATPRQIRDYAEENVRRADERTRLEPLIASARERAAAAAIRKDELDKSFSSLRQRLKEPAFSEMVGPQLRKARAELAGLQNYAHALRDDRKEWSRAQAEIARIEDERLDLSNLDACVAEILAQLNGGTTAAPDDRLRQRVRDLLEARRKTLESLRRDYEQYQSALFQLIAAQKALLSRVSEFSAFVDEHVLWVRSSEPVWSMQLPKNGRDLVGRAGTLVATLARDAERQPVGYVAAAALIAALYALGRPARRILLASGQQATRAFSDSFASTLLSAGATVVLALPIPVLLTMLGHQLPAATDAADDPTYNLARAAGLALERTASLLFYLTAVRQLCRPGGLGERHFRWQVGNLRLVRTNLLWLTWLFVPLSFLSSVFGRHADDAWRDSLGRAAFIAGMIVLMVFAQRLLRPEHGILASWMRRSPSRWPYQLRHVWFGAGVGLPLLLLVASALGYQYTAFQVARRVFSSIWLLFGLVILHALLVRWLVLAQRRLAIAQARKKRAALAEARAADPDADEPPPLDESSFDLVSIGGQTRRLLRALVAFGLVVGLWFYWSDLLPALSFLHRVQLWQYEVELVTAGQGEAAKIVPQFHWITLGHVAVALVIAVATYVLAKNIPGLLEIAVLQRLPLDTGGRFAITSIARYVIVIVGVVFSFSTLGIGWSKVQWLITAMLVGLGFGLQEIFANFISGLMLLLERPIRIGDIVTVGDVSGTVTRIRIRATTITNWDRKELIIPNKQFITGEVINWTLSDPTIRLVVPVGLAYGSDTDRAEALLYEIARAEPKILDDPAPRVLFSGFGDSSLTYELRVFLPNVEVYLDVRHRLHKAIDRAFRAAGLEIAFPQHDLHIRSIQAPIRIVRDEQGRSIAELPPDAKPIDR